MNKEKKILQLIPAPQGLWASHSARVNPSYIVHTPVVAFALVEEKCTNGETYRSVEAMHLFQENTELFFAGSTKGDIFHGFNFMDIPEEWKTPDIEENQE